MFTGIVEELGEVLELARSGDGARLRVRGPLVTSDAVRGASIAVDGACLTVTDVDEGTFLADVMPETLDRTTLGRRQPGDVVNLERPVPAGGRLGGHVVQGHVDATAEVVERVPGDRWELLTVALPRELARYVAEKGSVAVDGVSLTVAGVHDDPRPGFTVALIPTTLAVTTLGRVRPGALVNLEVDVLAKYVGRLLDPSSHPSTEKETSA